MTNGDGNGTDSARQFWLFQADPKWYKLVDEVPKYVHKTDDWGITPFRNQIKIGDQVILWQAGKEAGIYALGAIKSQPYLRGKSWRVDIQYEPLLAQPLFKMELRKNPVLRNLGVLRMPPGANPFRVTEREWQALQELISKDRVSIFKPYQQEENRFTNGLVALMELSANCEGPLCIDSFLGELLSFDPKGKISSFRVLRDYDGHADAEFRGTNTCVRLETKVESGALDEEQIERHLKWLKRAPQPVKALILLTPDDSASSYIKRFLSSKCVNSFCSKDKNQVFHLEWRKVYDYLKRSITGPKKKVFPRLVSQFLDQIHDRIFKQDFAGIIQKIAFGDESGIYAETTGEHTGYLDDDIEQWVRWDTPRKYEKLDGTGRKLLLYDPVRKGITVEFEISKVEPDKSRGKFSCRNHIVPNTVRDFSRHPIPLSHIKAIPGFENFTRNMAGAWNVTREQYRLLRELNRAE